MMKVAVPTRDERVDDHFGHCDHYTIFTIEDNKVISSKVIDNGGFGHEALASYLKNLGVETLILGNRGQGAIKALDAAGIKQIPGVTIDADLAVENLLKGTLIFNPNAMCDHSHHHH
jgi:predicted Fe-Mo cluster-binding NifX family protein